MTEEERISFRAGNGGQLNPDWTEWLMCWPPGWTDLKPLSRERMEDWQYRVSNRMWNELDPAELPKDDPDYIPRLTEDKTHRADRLKAIGNGQVPLCVYFMTHILAQAIEQRREKSGKEIMGFSGARPGDEEEAERILQDAGRECSE